MGTLAGLPARLGMVIAMLPQVAGAADARAAGTPAAALPGVVQVSVEKRIADASGPSSLPQELRQLLGSEGRDPGREEGSGFVYDATAGLVVAAEFVVADSERITLRFADGRTVPAELVAADEPTQLALLRAEIDPATAPAWGESSRLRAGEQVFALGYPFQLGPLVTGGIYAGIAPSGATAAEREYLVTDAPILPGAAGGPLTDAAGRVVGIIVGSFGTGSDRALGLAVPGDQARPILERLRNGPVARGRLGILPDESRPEQGGPAGAFVAAVEPGSGAAAAGLAVGDLIVAVNGQAVANASELRRRIGAVAPGTRVEVSFERNGSRQVAGVTLQGP